MTPRRPRLVLFCTFFPSKCCKSNSKAFRAISENEYQKSRVPWPLQKVPILPRGSRFGANSKSRGGLGFPKGVREKHVTASSKRGRVSIAARGTGTRLNFLEHFRRRIARNSVPPRSGVFTAVRTQSQSRPSVSGKKHVFRLDRFRGSGQSLGRPSCSSRRRLSRRAHLAV